MTARPIVPENRRRPVCAAVALVLVMVAVLLAAGCMGGKYVSDGKYVQEQDIEIVKINPNGSVAWNETLDYGNDEEMQEIIQTEDGNFIIAGGSSPIRHCNDYAPLDSLSYIPTPETPQLIGLSSSGEVTWFRNYSVNGYEGMISLFENPDRSLEAITKNGEFWHLNPDGSVITNRSINITYITSAVKTHDGGYVIVSMQDLFSTSGSNFTRLDRMGTLVWQLWINESRLYHISPVIELPDQRGYLFRADYRDKSFNGSHIVIARLSPEGTLVNETSVGHVRNIVTKNPIQQTSDGYILRYSDYNQSNYSTTLIRMDADGTVISSEPDNELNRFLIPSNGGGFLSLGPPTFNLSETDEKKNIEIKKIDRNGSIQWKNTDIKKGIGEWQIRKIIQTSDDGFIIMVANKKMSRC